MRINELATAARNPDFDWDIEWVAADTSRSPPADKIVWAKNGLGPARVGVLFLVTEPDFFTF